jgi:carotenoid cleavage dioxygenase
VDICLSRGNSFAFFPNHDGTQPDATQGIPHLTRFTFDLAANTSDYKTDQLYDWLCEMPRTDDRYQGSGKYRHGYVVCHDPSRVWAGGISLSAVGHFDLRAGKASSWHPGPDSGVQEPCFVPRKPNSPEGDGYVLALVNRMAENRSDLAILDAQTFELAALVKLPMRVRMTFHGMWVPQEALDSGRYSVSRTP